MSERSGGSGWVVVVVVIFLKLVRRKREEKKIQARVARESLCNRVGYSLVGLVSVRVEGEGVVLWKRGARGK